MGSNLTLDMDIFLFFCVVLPCVGIVLATGRPACPRSPQNVYKDYESYKNTSPKRQRLIEGYRARIIIIGWYYSYYYEHNYIDEDMDFKIRK